MFLSQEVAHELHDLRGLLAVDPVAGPLHVAELAAGEDLLHLHTAQIITITTSTLLSASAWSVAGM